MKWLVSSSNELKFIRFSISCGMGLESWLSQRFKCSKSLNLLEEFGTTPVNLFVHTLIPFMDFKFPNSSRMVPEI